MNSTTLDMKELQLNWAIDDVANGITELMNHFENTKDVDGLNALSQLVRAMNNYITVHKETMEIENE